MHRMITMHARPRQTDRRTNIMAIARRFVLTNALRKKLKTELLLFEKVTYLEISLFHSGYTITFALLCLHL